MPNEDFTLNAPELFIYNEQSSSSSLITQTSSSPIRDSTFSIESNLLQPLVQNQNHLINIPEPHSLSIQTPTPGMRFESWTEIEKYLDAYCSSKNFSKIIYRAEYDSEIKRHCRYRCKYKGQYRGKKTMVVEDQRNTCSKHKHENHPLDPLANKFGVMQRILTEPMLADIEFWTTKGNLNMHLSNAIQKVKREQQIDDEAATLINHLLEYKAEDTRWIINWRVDLTNNSLMSLFWITPDQYELYIQYSDVILYDNTYSTN
ncbi:hypothetical protein C2G38_2185277 [Gigaspora rosea]|uniref:FAR1 domain-containing protein n=1 Tax=Gigaspora rosea TaxID=44941 RepID=A0A397V7Z6_9GLOM|nr:hypothetical protein C2G38_2185277 [Gigaspora rosea]